MCHITNHTLINKRPVPRFFKGETCKFFLQGCWPIEYRTLVNLHAHIIVVLLNQVRLTKLQYSPYVSMVEYMWDPRHRDMQEFLNLSLIWIWTTAPFSKCLPATIALCSGGFCGDNVNSVSKAMLIQNPSQSFNWDPSLWWL